MLNSLPHLTMPVGLQLARTRADFVVTQCCRPCSVCRQIGGRMLGQCTKIAIEDRGQKHRHCNGPELDRDICITLPHDMAQIPDQLKNRPFLLIAKFGISPGKEARVMELLLPIYQTATSSAEPGCVTYRINRSVDRSQVLVYEEYTNEEAYKAHLATREYQAFMAAKDTQQLLSYLELHVMEEVKP